MMWSSLEERGKAKQIQDNRKETASILMRIFQKEYTVCYKINKNNTPRPDDDIVPKRKNNVEHKPTQIHGNGAPLGYG